MEGRKEERKEERKNMHMYTRLGLGYSENKYLEDVPILSIYKDCYCH
jgi:hypothetical protein